MPESTIDPPVKEPPVPPTPTKPTAPPPEPPEPEPDETAQASSLTFKQRINAVAQSLRGHGTNAEIEQLRAEILTLTTARDATQADLRVAQAALGVAQAERDRAMALAEAATARLNTRMAGLDQEVINKSIDLVAEAHVPTGQLPVTGAVDESKPQTREQVDAAVAAIAPDRPGHEGEAFQKKREILRAWRERTRK
jgi:hypothetical protein